MITIKKPEIVESNTTPANFRKFMNLDLDGPTYNVLDIIEIILPNGTQVPAVITGVRLGAIEHSWSYSVQYQGIDCGFYTATVNQLEIIRKLG